MKRRADPVHDDIDDVDPRAGAAASPAGAAAAYDGKPGMARVGGASSRSFAASSSAR